MNLNYKNGLCLLLLGGGMLSAYGQITNIGELGIAPETTVVAIQDFTNKSSDLLSNNGTIHLKKNLINNGGYTFDDLLTNEAITNFRVMQYSFW